MCYTSFNSKCQNIATVFWVTCCQQQACLAKLKIYINKALKSDFPLLDTGANSLSHFSATEIPPVLHPSFQLKHFKNKKYLAQIIRKASGKTSPGN